MKKHNISIKKTKKNKKTNKINKIKKQHTKTYKNKQLKLNGGANSSSSALVSASESSAFVSESLDKNVKKEYIDFIIKDSDNIRIELDNDNDINEILFKHFKDINNLICLDFHGVADLFIDDEKIPSDVPKCVISYIGGNQTTFTNTTKTITNRLKSNELILGIIVYNKDKDPNPGTKGWIISKIIDVNKDMNIHFIDDSWGNICCVNTIKEVHKDKKDIHINIYYINKKQLGPKEKITTILNKIEDDIKTQNNSHKRLVS